MIHCNPHSPKAQDPLYECNPRTGRWIKKKRNGCNPQSPKAQDPLYECNPRTGRWIKKKGGIAAAAQQKTCNPHSPKAQDPLYECNPRTGRWIKKKGNVLAVANAPAAYPPFGFTREEWVDIIAPHIPHHDEMSEAEIIAVISQLFDKNQASPWETECKRMEKECPMDCDLETNTWCSFPNGNGIFFFKTAGDTYCYRFDEIIQNLHREFTAVDTSYIPIPPLRLKIPTDPFTRKFIPVEFFDAMKQKMKADSYKPTIDFPEVLYFLKYYRELYANGPGGFASMTPVAMSQFVQQFLESHNEIRYQHIPNQEIKWVFRPKKKPTNLKRYIGIQ